MKVLPGRTARFRHLDRIHPGALAGLAAALITGCASSSGPSGDALPARADRDGTTDRPVRDDPPAAASSDPATSEPLQVAAATEASGDPVIGRIEDEAVRASAVLDILEVRLAELGRTLSRSQFRDQAGRIIQGQLQQLLIDRLVLADAQRALSEQQQETMIDWRERIRAQVIDQEGQGDPTTADQNLRAAHGRGLDEYVDERAHHALFQWRIRHVVDDQIEITDEAIDAEYRRRRNDFHTPGQQRIRLIRTTDMAAADRIDAALAAGTPFQQVAAGPDNTAGGSGQRDTTRGVTAGDLVEPLGTAVADLAPGEHSPRIAIGASSCWVELVERTPARTVALEDVRATLERSLRLERRIELQDEYIRQLLEAGTFTSPRDMTGAALAVAAARYAAGGM